MSRRPNPAIVGLAVVLVLLVVGVMAVACGGSPGGSSPAPAATSATSAATEKAREAALKAGIISIQKGIESWAVDHNGHFPKPSQVSRSGLAKYVATWPANPYTNQPMTRGAGPGDFKYGVSTNSSQYELIGYGNSGKVLITAVR